MAKSAVLASRVQANMLMVRMKAKDYIKTHSQKKIDEFNYYYNRTMKFVNKSLKEIQDPERLEKIKQIKRLLQKYRIDFFKVVEYIKEREYLTI